MEGVLTAVTDVFWEVGVLQNKLIVMKRAIKNCFAKGDDIMRVSYDRNIKIITYEKDYRYTKR